jgi:hypothetical protein
MTAFPPRTDIRRHATERPFRATTCREQMQQKPNLLDHLVGAGEQHRGHVEAERSSRLGVDDQLELRRLHDRQVGRLHALEDLTGVDADLTIHVRSNGPIAH